VRSIGFSSPGNGIKVCCWRVFEYISVGMCNVTGYNDCMIKSYAHKGLKDFYSYSEENYSIGKEYYKRMTKS